MTAQTPSDNNAAFLVSAIELLVETVTMDPRLDTRNGEIMQGDAITLLEQALSLNFGPRSEAVSLGVTKFEGEKYAGVEVSVPLTGRTAEQRG